MKRRDLNAWAALLACGLAQAQAQAQPPAGSEAPRYGVLSLIGRHMKVVTAQPTTGTRIDRNLKQDVELEDDSLDLDALRVVQESIHRAASASGKIMLYKSNTPSLFGPPGDLFQGGKLVLPADLIATMKSDGTTHLLLVTRHRQDAMLKAQHSALGDGKLEGLGYYVDYNARMRRSDTGEVGTGYLAPYVYLRLSLVDLSTSSILSEQDIHGSTTLSAARSKDSPSPWDALSSQQKMDMLRRIMQRELHAAVPKLLGAQAG